MSTLTQGERPYDFLLYDEESLSRDSVTVASGSGALASGAVLGRVFTAVVAKVSGTGNGNAAGASVTFGRDAQVGVYTLTCTAASTDAGTFSVVAPDGTRLADLTVASAYTSTHINLTIPDGSTDWGSGAVITVTTTAKVKPYNAGGTDGSQTAVGLLCDAVDATSADQSAVMITRLAEVSASKLGSVTDMARAQLANRMIIFRS